MTTPTVADGWRCPDGSAGSSNHVGPLAGRRAYLSYSTAIPRHRRCHRPDNLPSQFLKPVYCDTDESDCEREKSSVARAAVLMLFGSPVTRRIAILGVGLVLLVHLIFGVNYDVVKVRLNQLDIEVERRLLWVSPDTDEEVFCRASHRLEPPLEAIPNVAHFIMVGPRGEPVNISLGIYLALKAAVLRMGASQIKLHTWDGRVAENEYWNELKTRELTSNCEAASSNGSRA